ncbi:FMN-binding negative transcriptional regulator [Kurthia sibirica]|uniref:Transcriptional regulator n=1 Tax=Kurthia sibirica TaxID=202750 RepID=A0A2U3AIK1_9BACL|nr:FMN-binding negative transcriptional regulator [Kurthia sibirica]PWI24365.1 transcriptional regulator [Kurthia sibirica]GEK33782.1 protease synthase and sporulation protein PAI 2 [Kurthia sibirica]
MFTPQQFTITNNERIYAIIEENSFATLISQQQDLPIATHLPLLLNRQENTLTGHMALANDQWENAAGQTFLAIFQGPHCYISPSWYETSQAVPTWNYVAAHVYGKLELIEKPTDVYAELATIVKKYEPADSPYKLTALTDKVMTNLSQGIVAFKLQITQMIGVDKLSQNHSALRRQNVIEELCKSPFDNEQQIALLMKKNMRD